uniref:Uncharacterized protein n=1 Tax=Cacopsylla melanoneura TaxID=428564 RepID=A0A8D8W9Y1_9HEMI
MPILVPVIIELSKALSEVFYRDLEPKYKSSNNHVDRYLSLFFLHCCLYLSELYHYCVHCLQHLEYLCFRSYSLSGGTQFSLASLLPFGLSLYFPDCCSFKMRKTSLNQVYSANCLIQD